MHTPPVTTGRAWPEVPVPPGATCRLRGQTSHRHVSPIRHHSYIVSEAATLRPTALRPPLKSIWSQSSCSSYFSLASSRNPCHQQRRPRPCRASPSRGGATCRASSAQGGGGQWPELSKDFIGSAARERAREEGPDATVRGGKDGASAAKNRERRVASKDAKDAPRAAPVRRHGPHCHVSSDI